jgi:hypothetical protein
MSMCNPSPTSWPCSLGGLAALGLVTIIGGLVVLQAIWPLLAVVSVSVLASGLLLWVVRNAPT